jgi:hypothetical protein
MAAHKTIRRPFSGLNFFMDSWVKKKKKKKKRWEPLIVNYAKA